MIVIESILEKMGQGWVIYGEDLKDNPQFFLIDRETLNRENEIPIKYNQIQHLLKQKEIVAVLPDIYFADVQYKLKKK